MTGQFGVGIIFKSVRDQLIAVLGPIAVSLDQLPREELLELYMDMAELAKADLTREEGKASLKSNPELDPGL